MPRLKVYDLATTSWKYAGGVDPVALATDAAFTSRYTQRTKGAGAPAGTGTAGDWYYDTTNKRSYQSDGTGWIIMYEPEQTYTPTTTNLSNGTGSTLTGAFRRSVGECYVFIYMNMGTGSAGSISAPGPSWSLPVQALNDESSAAVAGGCNLYDANGGVYYLTPFLQTNLKIEPRLLTVSGTIASVQGQITNTSPITIQINDFFTLRFRFRMNTPYL